MAASRIWCDGVCDTQMNELQHIRNQAIANMTHDEMGLVLDAMEHYLPDILQLDIQVHTHQIPKFCRVIFWVEGPDYLKAAAILDKMAEIMVQRDPCRATTINEARSLFGLIPVGKQGSC